MATVKKYTAVGRRKSGVARVVLTEGTGKITVNGEDIKKYVPSEVLILDLKQPLVLTEMLGKVDVDVIADGGGYNGQTGAIRLGISRALEKYNPEFRAILKAAGMITRDARIKERKKYGLKKARRAPQFSKR